MTIRNYLKRRYWLAIAVGVAAIGSLLAVGMRYVTSGEVPAWLLGLGVALCVGAVFKVVAILRSRR